MMKTIRVVMGITLVVFVLITTAGFRSSNLSNEVFTKQQLGEKLFFDPILSADRSISCASCHKPAFAFADTLDFSYGINGHITKRNTPTVTNVSGRPRLFWDGRAASLEEQALGPIASPDEMGLPIEEAVKRLNEDKVYNEEFIKIFNSPATKDNFVKAIAAFERTLETGNSPYDRFINGDDSALTPEAKLGRLLFIGKANCNNCHSGEDFTANRFKNIGLFNASDLNDPGRFAITKDSTEIGAFKIPGLRNVGVTAPYMHNGRFKTLRQVVEYYNNPDAIVKNSIRRDLSIGKPLNLTENEVDEIVAFLVSLTDDRFAKAK